MIGQRIVNNILGTKPKKDFKSKNNNQLQQKLKELGRENPGDLVVVTEHFGDFNVYGPYTYEKQAKQKHDEILDAINYDINKKVFVRRL